MRSRQIDPDLHLGRLEGRQDWQVVSSAEALNRFGIAQEATGDCPAATACGGGKAVTGGLASRSLSDCTGWQASRSR